MREIVLSKMSMSLSTISCRHHVTSRQWTLRAVTHSEEMLSLTILTEATIFRDRSDAHTL